jgi:hypothetical protein
VEQELHPVYAFLRHKTRHPRNAAVLTSTAPVDKAACPNQPLPFLLSLSRQALFSFPPAACMLMQVYLPGIYVIDDIVPVMPAILVTDSIQHFIMPPCFPVLPLVSVLTTKKQTKKAEDAPRPEKQEDKNDKSHVILPPISWI